MGWYVGAQVPLTISMPLLFSAYTNDSDDDTYYVITPHHDVVSCTVNVVEIALFKIGSWQILFRVFQSDSSILRVVTTYWFKMAVVVVVDYQVLHK